MRSSSEQGISQVRSTKDIKRGLLKRAFAQNRGSEMIAEIQKRVTRCREAAAKDSAGLAFARAMDGEAARLHSHGKTQSRSIRAINLQQWRKGSDHWLREFAELPAQTQADENAQNDASEGSSSNQKPDFIEGPRQAPTIH